MYDAACLSEPLTLQRAVGELVVSVRQRDGTTVLDRLRQAGCLKARFPRALVPGWIDVVTMNTSGGIAGGDRLESAFEVQAGGRVSIAAQAAERFYRALPAASHRLSAHELRWGRLQRRSGYRRRRSCSIAAR
jgi:urease accessory protein